jgi:hypothetical protein
MEEKKKNNSNFVNIIVAFWIIIFSVIPLIFVIKNWLEKNKKPTLDEYREENYYITNGEDYVIENYDYEQENFTYQDLVDAYNAGLDDGIEQTTEYYESLEDDDDFF